MNLENIGKALGRVPSGLFILTANHNGKDDAVLVSWVNQCSFDPPTVSVVLFKDRSASKLVDASRAFILNILGKDDGSLIKRFSRPPEGESVLEGQNYNRSKRNISILSDTVSYLECELIGQTPVEDHLIYIGKIVDGGLLKGGEPYVHIRKSGLNY